MDRGIRYHCWLSKQPILTTSRMVYRKRLQPPSHSRTFDVRARWFACCRDAHLPAQEVSQPKTVNYSHGAPSNRGFFFCTRTPELTMDSTDSTDKTNGEGKAAEGQPLSKS